MDCGLGGTVCILGLGGVCWCALLLWIVCGVGLGGFWNFDAGLLVCRLCCVLGCVRRFSVDFAAVRYDII